MLRMIERTKAQAIHRRNWARAHRKDVAKNSPDTRCGTLKRFDERRMIVRLDLERRAPAVAEIDNAGVLARRYDHAWASRRQSFQMYARRFVRAVFRQHQRED